MNAMTEAMKTAGIKVPTLNERIWRIVKDNPGCTAVSLAGKANLDAPTVYATLHNLKSRNMVRTEKQSVMRRAGSGSARRSVMTYFTPAHMPTYELLPVSKLPTKEALQEIQTARAQALASVNRVATALPAQPRMEMSFAASLIQNHQNITEMLVALGGKADIMKMSAVELLEALARGRVLITLTRN